MIRSNLGHLYQATIRSSAALVMIIFRSALKRFPSMQAMIMITLILRGVGTMEALRGSCSKAQQRFLAVVVAII